MDDFGNFRLLNNRRRNRRVFLERPNFFETYSDDKFRKKFRVRKDTARYIVDLVRDVIEPDTLRNNSLNAEIQVLMTLRFYARGLFQDVTGELSGVSQPTVSRVVNRVSHALARLRRRFIYMPRRAELAGVKRGFRQIAGFPGVIGCIDCTHIPIRRPSVPNYGVFCNRKGNYTLNIQLVCDHQLRIRNVVARWPGSTHDSRIFNSSSLVRRCRNGRLGGYLLGDSGYACKQYLVTPVLRPATEAENRFNAAHISTRNCIERTNGVWKSRFRCISKDSRMRIKHERTMAVVVAISVLHNIAINRNELDFFDEVNAMNDVPVDNNVDGDAAGNAFRRRIIQRYF